MRVATRSTLITEATGIELTQTEWRTLKRAAVLADEIRARAIAIEDALVESEGVGGQYGDELARISIAVDELDAVPWPRFVPVIITDTPPTW